MKKTHILALVLGISTCAAATAAPVVPLKDLPLYWGASYSWVNLELDDLGGLGEGVDPEAGLGAVTARLGYQISRIFSAELRYTHGVRDDDVGVVGDELSVDLNRMYGIYGRASLPTDINFTPYGIIGYTKADLDVETVGAGSEDGASIGIGVDLCQDQPVCVNAEYLHYIQADGGDINGFNLGLKVRF